MKEDNLTKLKYLIRQNLDFDFVLRKFGKPKKAFLAYLERALMYMRMYGKYRLARWEMNQMDVVLSAYNEEEMDFFLMDSSKEEAYNYAYNYSPSDIEYLRSLNVYSHAERRVRTNLTKERLKRLSPSRLIGIFNTSLEGCGKEDKDICETFRIDDVEVCPEEYGWFNEDEYDEYWLSDDLI